MLNPVPHHHHHGHDIIRSQPDANDRMLKQFRANLNQVGFENENINIDDESVESIKEEVRCKECLRDGIPIDDMRPTMKTHIVAGILFLLFLVPFVYLPYVLNWYGKPITRCPNCDAFIEEIQVEAKVSEDSIVKCDA